MEDTVLRSAPRPRRRVLSGCVGALFNVLSVLLVLLTCASASAVAALFQYPNLVALIPPPGAWVVPTQPVLLAGIPTLTPASTEAAGTPGTPDEAFPTLPPEWTATRTPTVTDTLEPATETPDPTRTRAGTSVTPGGTITGTVTPGGPTPTATRTRSAYPYTLQNNSATYLANFINGSGCSWFGLAGQAFGLDGKPIIGLTVHLEGDGLSLDALTGSQPAIGPGGYEIPLGNHPVETSDIYTIELRNNTGTALSNTITVETFGDCARNLVLINFVQNH